jgi:hypothetical protein
MQVRPLTGLHDRDFIPSEKWKQLAEIAVLKVVGQLGPSRAVLYGSLALNAYLDPIFQYEHSDLDVILVVNTPAEYDRLLTDLAAAIKTELAAAIHVTSLPAVECVYTFHGSDVTARLSVKKVHIADVTRQLAAQAARVVSAYPRKAVQVHGLKKPIGIVSVEEILHRLECTVAGTPCVDQSFIPSVDDNAARVCKDRKRLGRLLYLKERRQLYCNPHELYLRDGPVVLETAPVPELTLVSHVAAVAIYVPPPCALDFVVNVNSASVVSTTCRVQLQPSAAAPVLKHVLQTVKSLREEISHLKTTIQQEVSTMNAMKDLFGELVARSLSQWYVKVSAKCAAAFEETMKKRFKQVQHTAWSAQKKQNEASMLEMKRRLHAAGCAISELLRLAIENHVAVVEYDKAATQVLSEFENQVITMQRMCLPGKCLNNFFREYVQLFTEFAFQKVVGFVAPSPEDMDQDCMSFLQQQCVRVMDAAVDLCEHPSLASVVHAELGPTGLSFLTLKYKVAMPPPEVRKNTIICVATSLMTALIGPLMNKLDVIFFEVLRFGALREQAMAALATHRVPEQFDKALMRRMGAVRAACFEEC